MRNFIRIGLNFGSIQQIVDKQKSKLWALLNGSSTHFVLVEGNIGLNYAFGKNNLFIEFGGNYGFLNIQKGSANGKNNTGAATIVLGYSFWIGEK